MKRRYRSRALVMLAPLVSACAAEAVELPPPVPAHWQSPSGVAPSPTTPTQKERGLADAYIGALSSPRLATLGPMLDEEVLLAFGGRDVRGRERVVKAHEDAFGAFDGRRFTASRVWFTDSRPTVNSQAIEWTMTGAHAREWMKIPATGKSVSIRGLTLLWTTDEGVITEIHVYFDEDVVRAQLGVGPPALRKLPAPVAGAGPPAIKEREGRPEETSNVASMRAMLQALEDKQESAFVSRIADDLTVVTLDEPEPLRGKESARTYFKNVWHSVREVDTVTMNAWGVGGFVIVEYAVTGSQVAPLFRVVPAREGGHDALHAQFVDIAEFHDGKVTRIWRYADPASFRAL